MTAIKVENLSKRYYFGDRMPNSLRDLAVKLLNFRGSFARKDEFLALQDLSFDVAEGDTLGIIGRNGAGKSTLLKILSRITKPTSGSAEIHGRVGSLLEVGTGFHSELTGRENIYMNGAILGMKRAEIERKFDEIVAFSEIDKFLDTPVKHYSTGMNMRLAFSVAAHLEPEVLIVDEVLAVGDMGFQKKCLGKMREVGASGRTILFVSHDMNSINRLCNRVIWLKNGEICGEGETGQVVGEYLHDQSQIGSEKSWDKVSAPGNNVAKLRKVRVCDENGNTVNTIDIRSKVGVEITYEILAEGKVIGPNCHFINDQGVTIFVSHDWNSEWRTCPRTAATYSSTVWIPGNFLSEGQIFVAPCATTYSPMEVHFLEWDAVGFNVADTADGDSARGDYTGVLPGVVRPILDWSTRVESKLRRSSPAD